MRKLQKLLDKHNCQPGRVFSFNARTQTITYVPEELKNKDGRLALLHEIAHMKLGHFTYKYDVELLDLEQEAWDETRSLAQENGIEIDEDHIKECLLSYDNWVTKRASCPTCGAYSLQRSDNVFGCFVCDCYWEVNDRKDRQVKKKIISAIKSTSGKTQEFVKSPKSKSAVSCFLFFVSSIGSFLTYR